MAFVVPGTQIQALNVENILLLPNERTNDLCVYVCTARNLLHSLFSKISFALFTSKVLNKGFNMFRAYLLNMFFFLINTFSHVQ